MGAIFNWVSATSQHSLAQKGGALDSGIPYTTKASLLQVLLPGLGWELSRQAHALSVSSGDVMFCRLAYRIPVKHRRPVKQISITNARQDGARGGRRHGHVLGAANGSREQLVSLDSAHHRRDLHGDDRQPAIWLDLLCSGYSKDIPLGASGDPNRIYPLRSV